MAKSMSREFRRQLDGIFRYFSLAKSNPKRPLMFRDFSGHETSRGDSFLSLNAIKK